MNKIKACYISKYGWFSIAVIILSNFICACAKIIYMILE